MSLDKILSPKYVFINSKISNKENLFKKFVSVVFPITRTRLKKEVISELLRREEIGNTYLGYEVALPHARCPSLKRYYLGFFSSKKGIEFEPQKKAKLIFILVGPRNDPAGYIRYITKLSRILRDEDVRAALKKAKRVEDILKIIVENENL